MIARRAFLGAAVALTLLAGCTVAPEPTPNPSDQVPAGATLDVNTQPRDRLRDGGLVRIPVASLPRQWNPHHSDATNDLRSLLAIVAPPHFLLDAAGRATPNPDFVTRAEASHGPATTVTLTLNPAAVWGDGTPIVAADWVATWRAASGRVTGVPARTGAGWEAVAEVRQGGGPGEVVVAFAGVEPDWAEPLVAGPQPAASLVDGRAADWQTFAASHYAGPFTVAHLDRTQGVATLQRNPLWWGDRARLDTVMLRVVPPEALAAAFQHNELDVWETGPSADRIQQTRAAQDTILRTAPGTRGRSLHIGQTGPLADAEVRRALLLALDRDSLAATDVAAPKPPGVWSNTLLLPTQPGYVDQARATGLGTDRAAAATALDKAGWTLSSGVRSKAGQALQLSFQTPVGDVHAAHEFKVLSQQLAGLGITLIATTGDADLVPATAAVSAFPLAHLPAGTATDPATAELATRVGQELDPVRRADVAGQLGRVLWQRAAEIPLFQVPQVVAVRGGLANIGAAGYATTSWEDVGWTP